MSDRWYPKQEHFKTWDEWNSHKQAFDHIYALQDQMAAQHAELKKAHADLKTQMGTLQQQQFPNGPSNTKIQGLNVRGAPPTNGQTLKYNSATGDISWQ